MTALVCFIATHPALRQATRPADDGGPAEWGNSSLCSEQLESLGDVGMTMVSELQDGDMQ